MRPTDDYEVEDDIDFEEIMRRRRRVPSRDPSPEFPGDQIEAEVREVEHLRKMGWSDDRIRQRLNISEEAYRFRLKALNLSPFYNLEDQMVPAKLQLMIERGRQFSPDCLPSETNISPRAMLKKALDAGLIVKVGTALTTDNKRQPVYQSKAAFMAANSEIEHLEGG